MSLQGTVLKSGILIALCIASAAVGANLVSSGQVAAPIVMFGGLIGGLILGLIISFSPKTAPFLSPAYAIAEGLLLGTISLMIASQAKASSGMTASLVTQAVAMTFGVFIAMLGAYATGLVRAGPVFTKVLITATIGLSITYLAAFVLRLLHINFLEPLFGSGIVGIGFSIIVVGMASLYLILDFQRIEDGIRGGAPKHMEWYAAFGLLVTLVWLYLEILRLLSKLNRRN